MTLAGWIFMIASWAVILGLFTFCLTRTLRPQDKLNHQNRIPE